jgi:hypothetical protein
MTSQYCSEVVVMNWSFVPLSLLFLGLFSFFLDRDWKRFNTSSYAIATCLWKLFYYEVPRALLRAWGAPSEYQPHQVSFI